MTIHSRITSGSMAPKERQPQGRPTDPRNRTLQAVVFFATALMAVWVLDCGMALVK